MMPRGPHEAQSRFIFARQNAIDCIARRAGC
jgi:hypothetical protein